MSDDWDKKRAEADIAQFKNVVEDATVEEVDEPAGKKDVEIAYDKEQNFIVESGEAVGVYYKPGRLNPETVHIDWENGNRTTVQFEDIATLEESEYYTE